MLLQGPDDAMRTADLMALYNVLTGDELRGAMLTDNLREEVCFSYPWQLCSHVSLWAHHVLLTSSCAAHACMHVRGCRMRSK